MKEFIEGFKRYGDFDGRSTRREYWMFTLFVAIIYLILVIGFIVSIMDFASQESKEPIHASVFIFIFLISLFGALIFCPAWAITIRRLRDCGYSPMYILFIFIPIVGLIILFIFLAAPSAPTIEIPNSQKPPSSNVI